MIIIGAGMAGLLAGGMIRGETVHIYEKEQSLPNNHSAVLRFRSSIVGDTLGIDFKTVNMMKSVHGSYGNSVADNLAYSLKCTGTATLRSIVTAEGGLHKRFIAPEDLIQQMSERVNGAIHIGSSWKPVKGNEIPVISTIPMPALMSMLDYDERPQFNYVHGININARLKNVDAYTSVYVPDASVAFNRVSLTGDRLTIEMSFPNNSLEEVTNHLLPLVKNAANIHIGDAMKCLGIAVKFDDVSVKPQRFSKILPIDESARKRFIMWASTQCNVYSLGRFASWRPGLLMDDVVNDVKVIQKLITRSYSAYDHVKK